MNLAGTHCKRHSYASRHEAVEALSKIECGFAGAFLCKNCHTWHVGHERGKHFHLAVHLRAHTSSRSQIGDLKFQNGRMAS